MKTDKEKLGEHRINVIFGLLTFMMGVIILTAILPNLPDEAVLFAATTLLLLLGIWLMLSGTTNILGYSDEELIWEEETTDRLDTMEALLEKIEDKLN